MLAARTVSRAAPADQGFAEEDMGRVCDLWERGMKRCDIAAAFGVPRCVVSVALAEHFEFYPMAGRRVLRLTRNRKQAPVEN